jgi:hypothetical protein
VIGLAPHFSICKFDCFLPANERNPISILESGIPGYWVKENNFRVNPLSKNHTALAALQHLEAAPVSCQGSSELEI